MTRKQRRLVLIGSGLIVLAIAAVLVLTALARLHRVLQFADRCGGEEGARPARASGSAAWCSPAPWSARISMPPST